MRRFDRPRPWVDTREHHEPEKRHTEPVSGADPIAKRQREPDDDYRINPQTVREGVDTGSDGPADVIATDHVVEMVAEPEHGRKKIMPRSRRLTPNVFRSTLGLTIVWGVYDSESSDLVY